jgi:hypothetical protein
MTQSIPWNSMAIFPNKNSYVQESNLIVQLIFFLRKTHKRSDSKLGVQHKPHGWITNHPH